MLKTLLSTPALQNLKKNGVVYRPFLWAAALMVFVYYTVCSYAVLDRFGENIPFGGYMQMLMQVGMYVMPFICAPFLLYINRFLMKHRRRELGLYGFLGLGKGHVGLILFFEMLFSCLTALAIGLLGGVVLGRLLFVVLLNLTGVSVDFAYTLSATPFWQTIRLFCLIFLLCYLIELVQISVQNPIALMREEQVGEKPARFAPLTALAGILCLGGGYYLSVTAQLDAFLPMVFLLASLLVIAGTYGVFTAGSDYLLRALRHSRRIYYRRDNFVTISGMIHRMRKNAAGLANICIFSTMVLVAASCAVVVYCGLEPVVSLAQSPPAQGDYVINLEALQREEIYMLFGTLIYLGIFFSLVFLGCMALIMYYKQITEGYEDRRRFHVMRQVGMDDRMVRSTVRRQILIIFFLPLIGTLLHMAFATPCLIRLLDILHIRDLGIILSQFGFTALIFSLVYLLIYWATARAYYRIIR